MKKRKRGKRGQAHLSPNTENAENGSQAHLSPNTSNQLDGSFFDSSKFATANFGRRPLLVVFATANTYCGLSNPARDSAQALSLSSAHKKPPNGGELYVRSLVDDVRTNWMQKSEYFYIPELTVPNLDV